MAANNRQNQFSDIESGQPNQQYASQNSYTMSPFLQRSTSRADKTKHDFFGHTSHFWTSEDTSYTGDHTIELRNGFVRKVYGILTAQLLLTVAICYLCMHQWSGTILAHRTAFIYGSFIPAIIVLFITVYLKDHYPANYLLLTLFTVMESFTIGVVCAAYEEAGHGDKIYMAAIITCGVFILLTLFACQTRIDFTIYSGLLYALLVSLIMWGLVCYLFGWSTGTVYSWLGALLFCAYIVVDTQMIMGKLGYDDYIIAAIDLYLDILNLFLVILRILGGPQD